MAGPWEKYGGGTGEADTATRKPWEKYGSSSSQPSHSGQSVPEFMPVGVEGYDPATGEVSQGRPGVAEQLGQSGVATAQNWLESIPIIGPSAEATTRAIAAGVVAPFSEKTFPEVYNEMGRMKDRASEENQVAATLGTVGGAVSGTAPFVAAAPAAFGVGAGSLPARMAAGGASSGALASADTAARGGDNEQIVESGLFGLGVGAVTPAVADAAKWSLEKIGEKLSPTLQAILKPDEEAARRVGTAITRDRAANPAQMMDAADEAVAREAGVPITNVDRGGETTRALARSVANQSPEVRAGLQNTVDDRFATQGNRVVNFVRRLAGGNVDDLAMQEGIRDAARAANKPAYDRAFSNPNAQKVFTPELQELMQSPSVQKAARMATSRSANRGAVEGFKAVQNPFHQAADGTFKLRQTADGKLVSPTLQFWDQVKRNLDGEIGKAGRAGDRTMQADLMGLKTKLVNALDAAVPEYRVARQGAAAFFGAEDALEAGKKFARSPRSIPEATKAFEKFTEADKVAFKTGFASEIIDGVKASSDRRNVISTVFKSQAAREQMELVFGKTKAREIEAYVRVEDLADRLRGALGNSTTARQLVELGIGTSLGGAGGYALGGDIQSAAKGAIVGAGVARGKQYLAGKEGEVMRRVGDMLLSDDPALLDKIVRQAALSPKYMRALVNLDKQLGTISRAGTLVSTQPKSQ